MKRTLLSAFLAVACGAAIAQAKPAAQASAGAAAMKPGLWEISTTNETAGSTTKRTVTARNCYSAEDVGIVQRIVPQQREFGMKCETRDSKQQGADVSWRVSCSGKDGLMSGSGKITLGPEEFRGGAALERKPTGAKPEKVTQTVAGKWISACK